MSELKQVIVMRTDLNMRKGKMIAQGAHASIWCMIGLVFDLPGNRTIDANIARWISQGMTKICVRCNSEAELMEIAAKARAAGLRCHVIRDAGHTEFDGPTRTCLAIGPNLASEVDEITGGLKLL